MKFIPFLSRILVLLFLVIPLWSAGTAGAKYYLDTGINLYQQERYFDAIDSLRNALEINPYYGDAYKYLAEVYFSLGEYNTSLENSLSALKYANNDPDAMLIVANSYRELGTYDKSQNYYNQIIEKFPAYAEVYRNLAELYMKMNKLPLALTTLKKADRVNKNHWKTLISFGNYYIHASNPDKAEEFFKKAFNRNPTERQVYTALAEFYRDNGNYSQAISVLETGEQIFDNFYSGILILADCYLSTGSLKKENYQKAIEKYKWIGQNRMKNDNRFNGWLFYKIALAFESLDSASAVNYYRQAIQSDPDNDLALYSFEQFALRAFKVDSPIRKDLAGIHTKKAGLAFRKGDSRYYMLNLKRAVTLYPFLTEARQKLVAFYEQNKDYYNAYQELNSLEKIDPSFKVKDKIANYNWNLKNKRLTLVKPEPYLYKGLFLVSSDYFNFSSVYSGVTVYHSEYFNKFKLSTLDFRKKQGINTILEYLRTYDYSYFIVAEPDEGFNSMKFTLFDKTARVIDSTQVNFRIEDLNRSAVNFLEWLDNSLPSIWVIGSETSPNTYTITSGSNNGIKLNDTLAAFNLDKGNFKSLSMLKVTRAEGYLSDVSLVSNFTKGEIYDLKGKYAVKSTVLDQKFLTKFKRVLGY